MKRIDNRAFSEIRPVKLTPGYVKYADGSCLIECGNTVVLCNASVEESVPPFMKGSGKGWVTAEYSMLPRSTPTRSPRDISKLKLNARSSEIQRLIGRSLRTVTNLESLGERSITIDCDVLQADGGTRCASITGGFVALTLALAGLRDKGFVRKIPLFSFVAAISCGIYQDTPLCDLCYEEDSRAAVDANFVMDDEGALIEVQATGEHRPYSKAELDSLFILAKSGIDELISAQKAVLSGIFE